MSSIFAPDVASTVLEAMRAGKTLHEAAAAAGITRRTLSSWLRRGRNGEPPYDDFQRAFEAAKEHAKQTALAAFRDRVRTISQSSFAAAV